MLALFLSLIGALRSALRTQANLARALHVSQPSASEMLRRMSDDGLVERDEHKLINFTERGRDVAERIVARHRLVEAYLVKVMGIPWDGCPPLPHLSGELGEIRGSYEPGNAPDGRTKPRWRLGAGWALVGRWLGATPLCTGKERTLPGCRNWPFGGIRIVLGRC